MSAIITSYDQIKELIISKYGEKRFFTAPYDLNLFGIRTDCYQPDNHDDFIGVAYMNEAGFKKFHLFEATTDPSTFYLLNPAVPKGTAILYPGHYPGLWQRGLHKGTEGLIQKAPCTVIRDFDRNSKMELDISKAKLETGIFGLNMHRYNLNIAIYNANKGSMGCQETCDPVDMDIINLLCDHQIKKLKVNSFSYTLFWENH